MNSRQPVWALSICLLAIAPVLNGKEPVSASHGMVVAQEPIAADVGVAVLQAGGNAVDAAVAVGFALAVTHPSAGNLGGGGFMLIRQADGKAAFLDFRECAPKRATRDMYIGPDGKATEDSIYGWRSSGVPGSVAGFELAAKKFGSRSWAELLTPALKLAREGFAVSDEFARSLTSSAKLLEHDPESKRIFLRGGDRYKAGEIFRQPELAETLKRIQVNGAAEFYSGETARQFAAAMEAHGGLIRQADLAAYKPVERTPLSGKYKGFDITTAPPPSAGGIGLLQMLGMLDGTHYDSDGADSAKSVHFEAEAMRRFYADRSEYIGDPDFYHVPVAALLAPAYLEERRKSIAANLATPSNAIGPGALTNQAAHLSFAESSETTHYNVIDKQGNAVAVTYTLNNTYGNGITVPGLGFLLNDEMDDLVAQPGVPNMFGLVGGEANAIAPGKRPLSSMTPTIISRNGKVYMAVGAPGGSHITTGVTQVILDVLDFGMNVQDAVDLPRFHHQWKPDILYLQDNFSEEVANSLRVMGYATRHVEGVARVEAIVVKDGVLTGGTESHLHGKVAGY